MALTIAPSSCDSTNIDNCSDRKLSDLEYVYNVLLLSKDSSKLQVFLDCHNIYVDTLCIEVAPPKGKMLQKWFGPKT